MNPEILYEDNHLLVAVKPQGMPSQPDASGDPDMLSWLKLYIKDKYRKPGAVYLGLVHRLDRPAGGVMVFARTSRAAARLCAQIREGAFEKRYLAVVCGSPPDGPMVHYLVKDRDGNLSRAVPEGTPGSKRAELFCRVLSRRNGMSLCVIRLVTGRSHQIRVQMAESGYPLYADQRYNPGARPGSWIALWAAEVAFKHPVGGREMRFAAPAPPWEPWNMFDDGETGERPSV